MKTPHRLLLGIAMLLAGAFNSFKADATKFVEIKIVDKARNEVDFFLSLRDPEGGYSPGLTNPSEEWTVMFQAGYELDGVDILGNTFCHHLRIAHGVNDGRLPVGHITAGKDALA